MPAALEFDATRVRQVVLNLVGNALKFTTQGEVIVQLRAKQTENTAGAPFWNCELIVRDTGPGIAPEDQAKIFEPFSRLEETAKEEGAGLGLALALALSGSMGGGIRIESDGRSGTTFIAEWRLRAGSVPAESDVAITPPGLDGWKILIADDNALVRELFTAYLTEQGASCASAVDGLEGDRPVQPGKLRRPRARSLHALGRRL